MSLSTTPTHAIVGSPRRNSVISRRWEYWRPLWMVWKSQFQGMYRNEDIIREHHAEWLQFLLASGIPMAVVRRHELDDPRELREELERRTIKYTERRQRSANKNVTHQS